MTHVDELATPSVTAAPRTASGRIDAVDALRGFALFGILVVHMVEQYLAAPPPGAMETFGIFTLADRIVQGIDGLLLIGKFFPIFALLFGVSIVIQAERGGVASSGRYVWRLLVLLGLGMAHHALYRGDILSIYALLALPLVALRHASDRVLLWTAAFLAFGGPRACLLVGGALLGRPVGLDLDSVAGLEPYYAAVRSGDLVALAASNLREGFAMKMGFQLGVFGRGYQTLALFLLGIVLARHRWHETLPARRPQLQRAWKMGLAMATAASLFMVAGGALLGAPAAPGAITRAQAMVFLTGYDVFNLGIALTFASSFVLLFLRERAAVRLRPLTAVGRTALTVYVSQSVIGTWLLYGHGLGLLGRIGASTALLFAVVLFAVQMLIATVWLTRFRYGPLEWLWRSLTMLKVAPLWLPRPPRPAPPTSASDAPGRLSAWRDCGR